MSRAELQLTWCLIFVSPQSRVANNHHQLFPTCYPHPGLMKHDTCRTLVDWPAVSFIFIKTKAPIWLGEYIFPWASTQASPFVALTILKEAVFLKQMSVLAYYNKRINLIQDQNIQRFGYPYISFWTSASSKRRPIRRLVAENVFSALVTAWRLAGIPTSLSPSLVNATTDGVVLDPSEFSRTLGVFPSITATHELVVPKSIPMTWPLTFPELS